MAIQAKFKLKEGTEIDAYIKLGTILSFKEGASVPQLGITPLKISYSIEYYAEKDGLFLKREKGETSYKGGNIWEEAYTDLKKQFTEYTDV